MEKDKIAVLVDGGFIRQKLYSGSKKQPEASDIVGYCNSLLANPKLVNCRLFRVYYYDCMPYEKDGVHPLSNRVIQFSSTPMSLHNRKVIQDLELQETFAVRKGEIAFRGWRLNKRINHDVLSGRKQIEEKDIVPDMAQKGVDMRIGLDIAWLAIKRIVDGVVLITGDADFIPAMKLARKEGLIIYLDSMNNPVKRELKVHADILL